MSLDSSPLRDRMIFLVGARRSGTNWLQRVVGAHPDVALVPSETYLFSRGIAPLAERFHQGVRSSPSTGVMYMDAAELTDALRDFTDRALAPFLDAVPGASRLAERTPEHVTCLGLIGSIYPDAHIVQIVRDGRDVARSLLSQSWASAPKTMEEAAQEWHDAITAAEAAEPSLKRYRIVHYEQMLADPPTHVTDLYRWLDLRSSPEVVESALAEAEVRYNFDRNAPAIGSGKWRASFSEDGLDAFMHVAGDTLARLGYDPSKRPDTREAPAPAPAVSEPASRRTRRFGRADARSTAGAEGETEERSFQQQVNQRTEALMRRLDRVVSAVTRGRPGEVDPSGGADVSVRFLADDAGWTGRGPEAWARLKRSIESDQALAGRQQTGEPYVSVPTSSAVMTFRTSDGRRHLRMVLVMFRGDVITRFTYYQFPLDV